MDRDVKRPVTNGEHDKNDFYNLDEHVGHMGSKTGKLFYHLNYFVGNIHCLIVYFS
jgi:hypothetical protein